MAALLLDNLEGQTKTALYPKKCSTIIINKRLEEKIAGGGRLSF
jgi:hypothetical protein